MGVVVRIDTDYYLMGVIVLLLRIYPQTVHIFITRILDNAYHYHEEVLMLTICVNSQASYFALDFLSSPLSQAVTYCRANASHYDTVPMRVRSPMNMLQRGDISDISYILFAFSKAERLLVSIERVLDSETLAQQRGLEPGAREMVESRSTAA